MKSSVNALEILYVDNHLLAACKIAGLLTQPNETGKGNLEDLAKEWVKKKYNKKGNVFLHPIHRLDKPASGIVLFARTSKVLSRLNAQMRERTIEKTYVAKIEGHLKQKSGELRHFLVHASHRAKVQEGGKPAHLSYTVMKEWEESSLVRIYLHTGRYHQIRAQFAHVGHPLVGDTKYGSKIEASQFFLHHTKLTFLHPITNKKQTISSKTPF